jgi:signal transduction histidine kinase/ABC-type multidrug transport system ATPase subunit
MCSLGPVQLAEAPTSGNGGTAGNNGAMVVMPAPTAPVAAAAPGSALRIDHVSVTAADTAILNDVCLQVAPGEIVGIAGESGSGKSTLVGCIAGRVAMRSGSITVGGHRLGGPRRARRSPIGIIWQSVEQCDNLDIADNLMLGGETRRLARSAYRLRSAAQDLIRDLGLDLPDVSQPMAGLTRGEQQLVAIARAMRDDPPVLVADDPTFALGAHETDAVEQLLTRLRRGGTAIVLISSDIHQLLRVCDRVAVMRHGRITTQVDPTVTHVDDLAALIVGERIATSARRQLLRIQDLADQLTTRGSMTSSLPLILTALGAALGATTLCLHVLRDDVAELASSAGLTDAQRVELARIPLGSGPIGRAVGDGVISHEPRSPWTGLLGESGGCFAVPITGSTGTLGAITVLTTSRQALTDDELDLVGLYAGYAANAIEHERLLGEITARNGVLETIRSALEVLSGPGNFDDALTEALEVLRAGTGAECVVLGGPGSDARRLRWVGARTRGVRAAIEDEPATTGPGATGLAASEPATVDPGSLEPALAEAWRVAEELMRRPQPATPLPDGYGVATFQTPDGRGILLARWQPRGRGDDGDNHDLLADTAHFLRLAFERQDADRARQEASALRRAEQLQQEFFARLSPELRTPLTAIRGYASSLTQPDVQWDAASQHAFLTRISEESDRLGRLVGDLLDFSAMESGVLTLHRDWCELPLVLDAARGCLPVPDASRVTIRAGADIPAVWADHDRLEQVFVNLIGNAIRHNPPETTVAVEISRSAGRTVSVTVSDDGVGLPDAGDTGEFTHLRSATSGSGLGLSIVRGIVTAHGGTVTPEPVARGTRWRIVLPEDPPADSPTPDDPAPGHSTQHHPTRQGSDDT